MIATASRQPLPASRVYLPDPIFAEGNTGPWRPGPHGRDPDPRQIQERAKAIRCAALLAKMLGEGGEA